MHSSFLSGKTREVVRLFLLLQLERLGTASTTSHWGIINRPFANRILSFKSRCCLVFQLSCCISDGCKECRAVQHGPSCSPGPYMVNPCCSESPLLCRGLDRPWGRPGWAAAGLGALWQPQARVCALCQVPKQVPNSGLADRRGGAVLQEEMRNHFTILDWLEK